MSRFTEAKRLAFMELWPHILHINRRDCTGERTWRCRDVYGKVTTEYLPIPNSGEWPANIHLEEAVPAHMPKKRTQEDVMELVDQGAWFRPKNYAGSKWKKALEISVEAVNILYAGENHRYGFSKLEYRIGRDGDTKDLEVFDD